MRSPILPATLSSARLRQLLTAYIAWVALVTLVFGLANARLTHPWILGEWLINYSGGFVRRGLVGQFLLLVHRFTHLSLIGLTAALQLALYAAFYASLLPLLRGLRWSLPLLALLLSPATLAFTVLDPPTSVRKEIFLFLALSLAVNALIFLRLKAWQLTAALAVAAPLLVLTHEVLAVYLPYLAVPVLLGARDWRKALPLLVFPALLAAGALAAVVTHPGSPAVVSAVCTSVGGDLVRQPHGLCGGAIAYLGRSSAEARAETGRAIRFYRYQRRYPLPILLTTFPIALLLWRRRGDRPARIVLATTAISGVLSLPLFVLARDWGRWTSIHGICLLLLFLLLERPAALASALALPSSPRRRVAALALLLLYATIWTLPAVGIFPGRLGYLDLFRYFRDYHARPHLSDQPAIPMSPPASRTQPAP